MALVYTDRIAELGAIPSTGTVGDSYANAMAEAINALFKAELIRARGPWRTAPQVELATLEWVWWWNNQRLHSELGYRTPAEVEASQGNSKLAEGTKAADVVLADAVRAVSAHSPMTSLQWRRVFARPL